MEADVGGWPYQVLAHDEKLEMESEVADLALCHVSSGQGRDGEIGRQRVRVSSQISDKRRPFQGRDPEAV